ncbi:MAG: iron-containing alcohol dehydrogenase [Clostridia bacterium]|nr:iron-containing alcohol dehydrogenase [Clostridia bacterium]
MNINQYMPVRVISGKNALEKAAGEIAVLGARCLIVTGGSAAQKSGALADTVALLTSLHISYAIFDQIGQNPLTAVCCAAGAAARAMQADFLIGIGGGSPLDATKAAALYASNPEISDNEIYARRGQMRPPIPYVLIGTTAGTGSEVTGVSVLTNTENGRKKSISGALCYARLAICDPKYTESAPYGVTVSTALDAFAHAAESYLSTASNRLSEGYALQALPMVWNGLKFIYETKKTPDAALREQLYYGSIFAGLAINITGTLFPHTVGYLLTEQRGIPHGRACTAFAPALFDIYERRASDKLQTLLRRLDTEKETLLAVIDALTDVHVSFTPEELSAEQARFTGKINNFLRTPGGFTAADALAALAAL